MISLYLLGNKYMFKVVIRNTKKCEIYSNLTIKTPKRRQWRRSGVFIVNLQNISLAFILLTMNMYLFTGLDIRVGFKITLSSFDYPRSLKTNKRIYKLTLLKLLLTRCLHLKILVLKHFLKFQEVVITVTKGKNFVLNHGTVFFQGPL